MADSKVFKGAELRAVDDSSEEYEYIASDETVDSYGDVIRVKGWDLSRYKKNPIILFGHDPMNPVGIATKTRIDEKLKALVIRIRLAEEGTSPFIDSLRKLVKQKIVRAVSVGFAPLQAPVPLYDKEGHFTGYEYVSQELLENSLVSIPANPSALQLAKSMNIPESHLGRLFEQPKRDTSVFHAQMRARMDILARRSGR